jgi:hypothetical protein
MKRTTFLPWLVLASGLVVSPAHAVYQCGPETDDCTCGGPNPFPCCDNGGNCTWWAWQSACCHWGVVVPMLGNANTWAGVAANDPAYEVLDHPVVNSIACRASGTYGHVAWVTSVSGSTINLSEMNCWGNYGVRDWTYDASYFDGGYIVLKSSLCDCSPGEEQSQTCGDCGTQTRQCGSDCKWGGWGACAGPDPGGGCDTGLPGACNSGELRCVEGNTQCAEVTSPSEEVCDGVDNDCDGTVDEDDVCAEAGTGGATADGGSGGGDAGGSGGVGGLGGSGGTQGGSGGGSTPDGGTEAGGPMAFDDGGDPAGCACAAVGGTGSFGAGWWGLFLVAVGLCAGRRREGWAKLIGMRGLG